MSFQRRRRDFTVSNPLRRWPTAPSGSRSSNPLPVARQPRCAPQAQPRDSIPTHAQADHAALLAMVQTLPNSVSQLERVVQQLCFEYQRLEESLSREIYAHAHTRNLCQRLEIELEQERSASSPMWDSENDELCAELRDVLEENKALKAELRSVKVELENTSVGNATPGHHTGSGD